MGEKEADPFIRICPLGVRSCFYVTGKYEDMGELQRYLGDAEAVSMRKHKLKLSSAKLGGKVGRYSK